MHIEYVIICLTSLIISIVTLFSGFGLGTVLMPVFALFFPLPVAIISTAIIHLANSLFKVAIVGRLAKWKIVAQFGIPAALTSAFGAYVLSQAVHLQPLYTYQLYNHEFAITFVNFFIGIIIVASSLFELLPSLRGLSFPAVYIPIGGLLSGLLGGISGNQGIVRSAFLIKSGVNAQEFIGTSVVCSVIVDVVRLTIYGWAIYTGLFFRTLPSEAQSLLFSASLMAFLGSFIGSKLMYKVTFKALQLMIGVMLLILGLAMAVGLT